MFTVPLTDSCQFLEWKLIIKINNKRKQLQIKIQSKLRIRSNKKVC